MLEDLQGVVLHRRGATTDGLVHIQSRKDDFRTECYALIWHDTDLLTSRLPTCLLCIAAKVHDEQD